MYLIIGLIVAIPVSARLYRYLTAKRVARMMDEQFARPPDDDRPEKK